MKSDIRVAAPPPKALMIYDGDCKFCTLWIHRWQQMTGDEVDYLPSQDPQIPERFPKIPREEFDTAVQLIEIDGTVYSGAEAVFLALAKNPKWRWTLRAYENVPSIARITEFAYGFVAGHRTFFSLLTRWLWGRHVERPDYFLTRWIFLRALGSIYLVAFVSLWMQISGLIGHNGILPAGQFMSTVRQQCDAQGIGLERFHLLPTLCWFDASDSFLNFQCAAGTICALLLMIGFAPAPCLALLWLLYLSLTIVGQDFLGFQWDNLLLETGFLAIFLAPLQLFSRVVVTPRRKTVDATPSSPSLSLLSQQGVVSTLCGEGAAATSPPSRIVLWLLRLLLFKLMFSSGCAKLLSGDPNWRNLTALTFHYQTQPLPTWIGWYANQLPLWFQKFSCTGMFAIELGASWLIFAPRRIRFAGCAAMVGLQFLILLTGNYTFFNFLTLALCVLLLDDFALQQIVPFRVRRKDFLKQQTATRNRFRHWPKAATIPLAIVVVAVSLFQTASMFGARSGLWFPAAFLDAQIAPFRSVTSYGLFAVMTTERREIIIEGSDDGVTWLPYEFKYKPGDVRRRPGFIEPFQPRLDWQMWFAALGDYRQNPWIVNFCARLLQGSPEVLALLAKNPFPSRPPRYLRAGLYEYHFTSFQEHHTSGAWWKRERVGDYLPAFSLADLQKS